MWVFFSRVGGEKEAGKVLTRGRGYILHYQMISTRSCYIISNYRQRLEERSIFICDFGSHSF